MFAPGFFATGAGAVVSRILTYCIWINLVLCFFNLLPLPPLDGSHVVMILIPDSRADLKQLYERAGVIILVALILGSRFTGLDLLPIGSVVRAVLNWLAGVFGLS